MEEANRYKDEGNKFFNEGNYGEAATFYTKAISVKSLTDKEKTVFLKNRAACFLKLNKYHEAAADCTKALEVCPVDTKALFRRCQALEQMGQFEEAYKDARTLVQVEPKNAAIQPIVRRLHGVLQEKVNQSLSTDNRVTQMFDLTFKNTSEDEEKRKQAANNLIVLARESAGAEKIFQSNGVTRLIQLLDTEKDKELKVTSIRVLACLAGHNKDRARAILDQVTLKKILLYIASEDETISTSMTHVLQNIINSISNLDNIKKDREKHEAARKADPAARIRPFPFVFEKIDPDSLEIIDPMLKPMIQMLGSGKVSKYGRDNIMELFIKFVTRQDGLGWPKKFIEAGGIQEMLTVAGTIPEHKTISVSQNSRMHVSLCLSKIYDDLLSDQEREIFSDAAEAYFSDLFRDEIIESKLEAVLALAALLQGVSKVGNAVLSKAGVLDLILTMADSGDAIYVKYAVEALVQSASKKEKCSGVIKQATPILKQLYQSPNESIKVRALVGLCKLGSFGGDDTSIKTFADGSNQTLAKACRRFLCNPAKDVDLRKWAAEGLAYLTLDADIKEDLVQDSDALKSLIDLAKVPDKGILYPVASIFVNVTNTYEKKEIDKELLELAKYAKHHIPEEHEKDKEPFIGERVEKLVKAGIVNALVAFSKSESESSNELLARVYLAICTKPEHRGLVVQQGGAKTLIPLANEGTEKGKILAAHALAKLAISQNPEIAFPGQRACEVIRPLVKLLGIERTAVESYEALLALTNLAAMNDTVRKRILTEKGFSYIEHFCYEDHDELRRSSVECLCNLVQCEEVVNMFKGENDRVKLLVLYSGMEDEKLVRAATGALAVLSYDPVICHKIITCTKQWLEILSGVAAHEQPDIQHRGVFILHNMMCADKEVATMLVDSNFLEILMAITKLEDPARKKAGEIADMALKKAEEWELIASIASLTKK